MLEFAKANPVITFLIIWVLVWGATRPFYYTYQTYRQTLRARNIFAHGWPTPPIDADGDIVNVELEIGHCVDSNQEKPK